MDHRGERAGLDRPPKAPANTRNPGDAGAMDSLAAQDAFRKARTEPLITLGAAGRAGHPQGGPGAARRESRLVAAIDTGISGEQAHSRAFDADTKGAPARHPPARRHRDLIRVLRRADR